MSMVRNVVGGVDRHADFHVAAAVDHNGGLLGVESFPVSGAGFEELVGWLASFGEVTRVGIEGTGSWGVGLSRFLADQGVETVEVDRPNRQTRRKHGKSDPTDAVSAARAVLYGQAAVTPKARNGPMEQMRVLATIRAIHSIAWTPREIAVAPSPATLGVLEKAGWTLEDPDIIEVNEAFAAVPLVSARHMAKGDTGLEKSIVERMNPNGGAVAMGHPTGASGARIAMTAAMELQRRGGGRATAAICGGLGMADAVALEV